MITTAQERRKYEKIWAVRDYHRYSPGEGLAAAFVRACQPHIGDTVIDLGCGTGRAGQNLAQAGLSVFLLDFVNAVDAEISLPFVTCCLWEPCFADGVQFDWIFCADVLEHIPPERVDATLATMARLTRKGGILQIAMFADGFGRRIGERLHLTVEDKSFWLPKLEKLWKVAAAADDGQYLTATLEAKTL